MIVETVAIVAIVAIAGRRRDDAAAPATDAATTEAPATEAVTTEVVVETEVVEVTRMKLLLRSDVDGVGKRGDIVDVADGFARNYLVPKGFAIKATGGVQAQADVHASLARPEGRGRPGRRRGDRQDPRPRGHHRDVPGERRGQALRVGHDPRGRSRPSTTQTGIELERKHLHLDEPIKTVGTHHVAAKLHPEVQFQITVEVSAS